MQDQSRLFLLGFMLAALATSAAWFYYCRRRSRELLRRWADGEGYKLLHYEHRVLGRGLVRILAKNQAIYRVVVLDKAGHVRKGFVRLGDWWRAILADRIEAKMDDPDPSLTHA